MKTVKFFTLGCKVNQYETQSIRERFLKKGFKEARDKEKADFYLVNTCTVTAIADRKSQAIIRNCVNDNPKARVIVTGCMVKQDQDALAQIKGVNLIVSKSFFAEGVSSFSAHTRAFLKIQDGCNNFCSYCKVPLVRGRSRSKPLDKVIQEAAALAGNGFKEIVLTGICLGSYGFDLFPKVGLVELLDKLQEIEGILRIRLSSIEAGDISKGLISRIANSDKLCRHLHIPVQSGDDSILKKMKRKYNRGYYIDLIEKIKSEVSDVAITTDCLVGFPGEGEKNFKNTLSLIRLIQPLRTHVFPYSSREGTAVSFCLKKEVKKQVIAERLFRLRKVAEGASRTYRESFLGRKMDVLFEDCAKGKFGYWQGYTGNYIKVIYPCKEDLNNKLINLWMIDANDDGIVAGKDNKNIGKG